MRELFKIFVRLSIVPAAVLLLLLTVPPSSVYAQQNDSLYVRILSPKSGQVIKNGLNTFWGFIFGQRRSLLEKEDYQWHSDKDGFLEYGRIARVSKLSLGAHYIVFSITAGDVVLASDTVGIVVRDQYIDREPEVISAEVPDFPEDYEVKGVLGIGMLVNEIGEVDSVLVLENSVIDSTVSDSIIRDTVIEKSAIEWAENTLFEPAEERGVKKSSWTAKRFAFPPEEEEEIDVSAILERVRAASRRSAAAAGEIKKPKIYGTGEPVAVAGLPEPVIQGFKRLSKKKKSLVGMIKACIKVDLAGLVTEILIIENTFKDEWVEEDLIKMLYQTLYEPVMEEDGPRIRECYTGFIVEENYFKEMKGGDFTNWKDEYGIKFAQMTEGEKPDIYKEEDDVNTAVGSYRIIASITLEGEVKNIKEIDKSMNRGKLRGIFKDAYKERIYEPAVVNGYPAKSYILPYFSLNNPDDGFKGKMLISYNSGFQFYIKNKFNLAIKDFKDALFADSKNDFTELIPQIIFCYEQKKEKNHKKKIELYEQAIWKNAYYRDFEVLQKLKENRNILKESIDKKLSFFTLLPEDRYNLSEICSIFEPGEEPESTEDPFRVYEELKYPKKCTGSRV